MAHFRPIDHAALLRVVSTASPGNAEETRWWHEIGFVAVNAANLEWLMQRLIWCEAGLTARTSPLVPRQFDEAALLAARFVETSIPEQYQQQVSEWIDESLRAMELRDELMCGCWIESTDAQTPANVSPQVLSPCDGAAETPSADEIAEVSRGLREVCVRGVALFRELAAVERRFAQAGFGHADSFRLVNPPTRALLAN